MDEPMSDPDADRREAAHTAWRSRVQGRLEARGWWVHVSGYAGHPTNPTLWLSPDAPAGIEAHLQDLVADGLHVERGIVRLEWGGPDGARPG